jgi:poly [ADP-ribose] polymerase 16
MSSDPSKSTDGNHADLTRTLQNDLLACDLKYSLFNAAAHSITYDSCLKPFPPMFTSNGFSNIDQLIQVLATVPPLRVFCDQVNSLEGQNTKVFLEWLLMNEDIRLTTVDRSRFDRILEKPGPYNRTLNGLPTFIFEVTRRPNSTVEQKFQKYSEEFGTEFAFHGSKTSNFYSILNHGLNQHLNKQSLFGEGIKNDSCSPTLHFY